MADTVTDPPVMLIPNERFGRLSPAPGVGCYRGPSPITEKRQKELRKLEDALEEFTVGWANAHSYLRAADELRELATGREAHASTDGFLQRQSTRRHIPVLAGNNQYFGNMPDVCWRMRVAFGR